MIYEYKDLAGVIKVGDVVRAVPGKYNPCSELQDGGGNEQKITSVSDRGFKINGCGHTYSERYFLEIIGHAPSWGNLNVGDVLMYKGSERTVLAVLGGVFLSSVDGDSTVADTWYTVTEAQNYKWTLKGQSSLTRAEAEAKLGVKIVD